MNPPIENFIRYVEKIMKKLIAGNWKMNTSLEEAKDLAQNLVNTLPEGHADRFDMLICPPSIWLSAVNDIISNSAISLGGQDCHQEDKGAFTGNITAKMLTDIGATYVILGHSERRAQHNESDDLVAKKAEKAHEAGLVTIICVGEQEADREANIEEDIVAKQLQNSIPNTATADNTVIAYEPVWAIGTGKTATVEDIAAMHQFIRQYLSKKVDRPENMRILYGGSAKPGNAQEILSTPNVDGVLVGGASLNADDFMAIAKSC